MPKKTNVSINGTKYYRVTATIGRDVKGNPIRKQFYGSGKKEAELKRNEYLLNINKGLSIHFDKAVFRYVFDIWFENVLKPTISLSSYRRYLTDYRLRISNCPLSPMKLADIRSINVQIYYNELLDSNSANTVRNIHKLLSGFFSYCIKSDLIAKNPLIAVEVPKNKAIRENNYVIDKEDIARLVHAAKNDINCFIFVFALFTGLRQGELLALTHSDVDMSSNTIRVNKSVSYFTIDGQYKAVVSATKTTGSTREVPILNDIKGMLQVHVRKEKEKHLKLGIPFGGNSILFSSVSGTYLEASNVRKRLSRLYKNLGIKKTTFHALRHTFCTLLAEAGVPLKAASVLMGHSDISITAKIYTHVDNKELKKGIEKLSAFLEV